MDFLSFNVQGKLKEFSVRKVLGAEPKTIVRIVGKQYVWILLVSFIIGAPLGSIGMYSLIVKIFPEPKTVTCPSIYCVYANYLPYARINGCRTN